MNAHIKEILDDLDLKSADCVYCDVRLEETTKSAIHFRNGELHSCDVRPSLGAFVRVFNNGKWFYCSTTALERIAEALGDLIGQSQRLEPSELDPFSGIEPLAAETIEYAEKSADRIPTRKKLALCRSYIDILQAFPQITESHVHYADVYKVKHFKSSKSVRFSFDFNVLGIMMRYTLKDGERLFEDYYEKSADSFQDLESLQTKLQDSIEESATFLPANTVTPGHYTMVLGSRVVGIFAHESFGHKSEADFMLGDENAKQQWKLGSRVGADILSIVDHGGHTGTSGHCPFDDEGTPASKTYLIKNGVLSGRLHSLLTAHELNEQPTGNGRAVSFEYEPIVRMTGTYVEPGERSFQEAISKIELGVYIKDSKHGSGLSTFTIAPRKAYFIRNGKLAEPVRVSVISGTVFQTLKDIVAVSNDFELHTCVFGGCGKMEQRPLPVAFGGPSMVVKSMQVS